MLYGLAGLFARDPWKQNDASGFGVMWSIANSSEFNWLLPNIAGRPFVEDGPLMFWLGALTIKLFGSYSWIGELSAARIATALCFFTSCILLWRTALILGQRPETQPYPCVFHSQPKPKNYSLVIADNTILIFLACFGLAPHLHESTASMAQLTLIILVIYFMVSGLEKPVQAIIGCGLALGGLILASGPILAITVFLAIIIASLICIKSIKSWFFASCALIAIGLALCWPIALFTFTPNNVSWILLQKWISHDLLQITYPNINAPQNVIRNFLPYAWPVWPLALIAVISWRKVKIQPHITIPSCMACVIFLLILLQKNQNNTMFMLLIPPLALLASFSLPAITRSIANAIDWFSLMLATFFLVFLWLSWGAQLTGFPTQIARNFSRILPGFVAKLDLLAFSTAIGVTIIWLYIVRWRLTCAPQVIWRSSIILATGTCSVWLLMMSLWLPNLNYAKTYRNVALNILRVIPDEYGCIYAKAIGNSQLASLAYFTRLRFSDEASNCLLAIEHVVNYSKMGFAKEFQTAKWQLLWQGHRPADRDERFRLYFKNN